MTQSLLRYGVLRVVRHPGCREEDLSQLVDLPQGHHRLQQAYVRHRVHASGTHSIQVSLPALLPTSGPVLLAVADAVGRST
jgi:hypothetical protein